MMLTRLVTAAAVAFFSSGLLAQEASPIAAPWLGRARIAGAELFSEMTADQIAKSLQTLAEQKVSVVEADSDLSRFMTEKEFETEVALMRRYSAAAHRLGLRVVWYYPALEVLSANAARGGRSMARSHPTWLQRGVNGKANVFYGGSSGKGRVHWVEADTESAWMSLHSPYVEIFLDRIRKIAATGVDGIWLDVPIYNDIGVQWADTSPSAAAKFRADTGLEVPRRVNWNDPAWRRWIAWRYREISNFILRTRDAAMSVKSDMAVVVETVTVDYGAVTMLGLDGSTMKTDSGVIQAWEVDAVSDGTGMRDARPDDWISLIGMAKFAKGASGRKPSWMFTYGKDADDGMLVMAEALAAGNHPYETRIPEMMTSVGAAYRKRMFAWIEQEERRLFASESAARVAVYYSPESRDYLDKAAGTGLFATTKSKDDLWWSDEENNSVYSLTYLAEYRGTIKWLVHNHIPFDIVVRPDAAELSRYETVIAPSLAAISDRDADLLDRYVAMGGNLAITGPKPAMLDEFGNQRADVILQSLTRRAGSRSTALSQPALGGGRMLQSEQLLGKAYLVSGSAAASRAISELLATSMHSPIETDAEKAVHIELRTSGSETLLHLINPERLWNRKAQSKRDVAVSIDMPPGVTVLDVHTTSPERPAAAPNEKPEIGPSVRLNEMVQRPPPGKTLRLSQLAKSGNRSGKVTTVDVTDKIAGAISSGPAEPAGANPKAGKAATLPFTTEGNRLSFKVPLQAYEMVVISTKPR
jgi:hypothetical protein